VVVFVVVGGLDEGSVEGKVEIPLSFLWGLRCILSLYFLWKDAVVLSAPSGGRAGWVGVLWRG
jgi:hypothetical protein